MPTWQAVLVGIIPSIGVGLIFWFAIRSVIRADRNERAALARMEAEQDAAEGVEREDAEGATGTEPARNSSAENSADSARDIQT